MDSMMEYKLCEDRKYPSVVFGFYTGELTTHKSPRAPSSEISGVDIGASS